MPSRPCLTCGTLSAKSYCPEHQPKTKTPDTHPRRMRSKSEYKTNRKRALIRDGYQCRQCGSEDNLTVDHFIPLAKGGGNEIDNLWTLCKTCHDFKTRIDQTT